LLVPQRVPEIVMGLGAVWLKGEGALIRSLGAFGVAGREEDVTQVDIGAGQVWIDGERLHIAGACLPGLTRLSENVAEVGVEVSRVSADGDGLANEEGGCFVVAGLVREHAQQVEAVGVGGVDEQHVAVDGLSG
jgi:hypothetical protein